MLFSLLVFLCFQNRGFRRQLLHQELPSWQDRILSYISLLGASFFNTSSTPKLPDPKLTGSRLFLVASGVPRVLWRTRNGVSVALPPTRICEP
jgi:hypothetical protein